ncbi:Alpha/beta-Hydrolases superfamily protein isoform 2 [Hibiscus syriacus]|uniref:Alpha/beta-Hydrolases superfamily protein isoform 2 n=2 Tax=Hibiscus syriacus TaxID=106335 RepID=A0A6A2XP90_HIBSY|nr:Alpha/beta-Hydrolases superfamily protein isoform 2 [Hibiscus syriacus]
MQEDNLPVTKVTQADEPVDMASKSNKRIRLSVEEATAEERTWTRSWRDTVADSPIFTGMFHSSTRMDEEVYESIFQEDRKYLIQIPPQMWNKRRKYMKKRYLRKEPTKKGDMTHGCWFKDAKKEHEEVKKGSITRTKKNQNENRFKALCEEIQIDNRKTEGTSENRKEVEQGRTQSQEKRATKENAQQTIETEERSKGKNKTSIPPKNSKQRNSVGIQIKSPMISKGTVESSSTPKEVNTSTLRSTDQVNNKMDLEETLRASDKELTSCGPYAMKEDDAMVYRRPYITSGSSGFALNAISRAMKKELKACVEDTKAILTDENWIVRTTVCWGQRDRWLNYDEVEDFCKNSNHKLIELPMAGHHVQEDSGEELGGIISGLISRRIIT